MAKILAMLVLLFLFPISMSACQYSNDVADYLDDTNEIWKESSRTYLELAKLMQDSGQHSTNTIINELSNAERTYHDLLRRFKDINCPSECMEYRDYCIDCLTLSSLSVEQYRLYMTTNNEAYYNAGYSYDIDSEDARLSAADEWDKLADEAEGGTYIPIWLIVLGVMFGLPIALSIIYFVFTIGFVTIYGSLLGIFTGIKKVFSR